MSEFSTAFPNSTKIHVDGAQMLAPMPIAATLGLGAPAFPMITAFSLGLNGNAVTVNAGGGSIQTQIWMGSGATHPVCGIGATKVIGTSARQASVNPWY